MIGTNTQATQNMMNSVVSLAVASHMVRLWFGMLDDGMTKGNMLRPAGISTMAIASAELTNASACLRALLNRAQNTKQMTPSAGTAIYNVTPLKVGKYFHKIECFCFGEQVLQPGQEVQMPVLFYVDPAFADDPHMEDVSLITLSYTFYHTESDALEKALEEYYDAP